MHRVRKEKIKGKEMTPKKEEFNLDLPSSARHSHPFYNQEHN